MPAIVMTRPSADLIEACAESVRLIRRLPFSRSTSAVPVVWMRIAVAVPVIVPAEAARTLFPEGRPTVIPRASSPTRMATVSLVMGTPFCIAPRCSRERRMAPRGSRPATPREKRRSGAHDDDREGAAVAPAHDLHHLARGEIVRAAGNQLGHGDRATDAIGRLADTATEGYRGRRRRHHLSIGVVGCASWNAVCMFAGNLVLQEVLLRVKVAVSWR